MFLLYRDQIELQISPSKNASMLGLGYVMDFFMVIKKSMVTYRYGRLDAPMEDNQNRAQLGTGDSTTGRTCGRVHSII